MLQILGLLFWEFLAMFKLSNILRADISIILTVKSLYFVCIFDASIDVYYGGMTVESQFVDIFFIRLLLFFSLFHKFLLIINKSSFILFYFIL